MTPILEVKHLSYIYGADTPFERRALDDVSLAIVPGEAVGIIGHTGSGKSTLIQHFNGLLKPHNGQVFFEGQDLWKDNARVRKIRSRVGLVFQYPEYQLFEETVRRDISFGPRNMGLDESEVEARVEEAMAFVGLPPALGEKSPFELSGGQKRRVAIAGVIAMRPEVLVLDEPTAGLDPKGRDDILAHIAAYREKQGCAVVLVTHSMEEIARAVSRVVVLSKAKILMDAPPREVFSRVDELRAVGLNAPAVTRIMLRLRELGLEADAGVYTVDAAREEILRMVRRGGGVC